MVDRALGEAAAHGEAGVPGTDDGGRGVRHAGVKGAGQASSTSTFVGLVTMSKTAERFCD